MEIYTNNNKENITDKKAKLQDIHARFVIHKDLS